MRNRFQLISSLLFVLSLSGYSHAEELSKPQIEFFENQVRPLLVKHCYECHAGKENKGGLQLDSRAAMLAGGESGSSLEPGKPEESLLIESINYEGNEMPPSGQLKPAQIEILTRWVKLGAPWPNAGKDTPSVIKKKEKITDEDRAYWAFQPLKHHQPVVADNKQWNQNSIDKFVYQKLKKSGIKPAQPADKRTLLRRISFDLTGLPSSSKMMADFLADDSAAAYEKIVDQLLASPRYGEHMASHWLDLVRYAESDGYRADFFRKNAWQYRDYVIRSFNQDKPYDQFTLEQLAGDEIATGDPDAIVATGFLRHWIYEYNQRDVETQWKIILDDITDTTGDVFLGVGMGCAKCHDHKFDPILQSDYYRLQAFFAPILPRDDVPIATTQEIAEYKKALKSWEEATAEIRTRMEELDAKAVDKVANAALIKFPPEVQVMMNKRPEDRTPYEHQIAEMSYLQVQIEIDKTRGKVDEKDKEEYDKLAKRLKEFDKPTPLPQGDTVTDTGNVAPTVFIPDKQRLGEVSLGFLSVIDPANIEVAPLENSTGRRTELARWITSDDNQLANRVIANRIWQWCFGRGLVATANDFGHLGEAPSHPELLDYLTLEFIKNGRSIKKLQKEILLSQTYRQSSSNHDSTADNVDPSNRLLWKSGIRRLSAEQVRDAMLAASGELDLKEGGPSVPGTTPRRSVYVKVLRNTRDPLLDSFDFPLRFNSNSTRNTTTTANQALLMINGAFPIQRARKLAQRSRLPENGAKVDFIRNAFQTVYSRAPLATELEGSLQFLEDQANRISEARKETKQDISVAQLAGTQRKGFHFGKKDGVNQLSAPDSFAITSSQFSFETVVQLNSMYEDASVRTIASQWNGSTKSRGWNLGVTSKKSNYTPRNLIMQLVGDDQDGNLHYEVISSLIHLELEHAYHIQVSVDLTDPTKNGIHFTAKDLTDKEAKVQTASVSHTVVSKLENSNRLVIAGRDTKGNSNWDGIISEFSIYDMINFAEADDDTNQPTPIAHWTFDSVEDGLVEKMNQKLTLSTNTQAEPQLLSPKQEAEVDFCHLLLNSNEFIYID